jgi:hypothetical protein
MELLRLGRESLRRIHQTARASTFDLLTPIDIGKKFRARLVSLARLAGIVTAALISSTSSSNTPAKPAGRNGAVPKQFVPNLTTGTHQEPNPHIDHQQNQLTV